MKIRFDEETYTSFTVADKLRNSEEYGEMILESTHEVDYIEARPVDEGNVKLGLVESLFQSALRL